MPETMITFVLLLAGYLPLMTAVAVVMFALWLICYKIRPAWGERIDATYEAMMGTLGEEYDELYLDDDTRPIARIR